MLLGVLEVSGGIFELFLQQRVLLAPGLFSYRRRLGGLVRMIQAHAVYKSRLEHHITPMLRRLGGVPLSPCLTLT